MKQEQIRDVLCNIGMQVCKRLFHSLQSQSLEERSAVHAESADDTIYRIDRDVEDILVSALDAKSAELGGIVLIAEGVGEEGQPPVFPQGAHADRAALRIIIDPIDGTRGLMYDKRSAFFLAGSAPNRGDSTTLQDIEVAAMVELPTTRSRLSDTLWAIRGQGVGGFTRDLETGERTLRPIAPSRAKSILGGFAQISRFFPPGRHILAQIEEEMIETLFPDAPLGRAILFEDQYISTGGQLYEILMGRDRFIADLRGGLYRQMSREGRSPGLICHPYDVCACLIGVEAGVIITGGDGKPLDAPLDTTSPVDWIAYANPYIRAEVEPVLRALLDRYGFYHNKS
ncbi:MAG: hypothetical protein C4527_04630 [Candidatus Omnitrophota bacterium]|jgi:fructose-1,6-bisphosphatase/inositol monophosphatase family enzyme|nr:MAG: hypothetical protein C4527_04630 [Candidatus Omnitrophota bacterium]